jgi:Protein of unknown function (DUF3118).
MTSLQHFILTRFNIRIWRQDKSGNAVRTREWLENRCVLFEKYCLPSITHQTCKDFQWIVLFDDKTPEEFRKRIRDYQVQCPQLLPVFVAPEDGRDFGKIFRSVVLEHLSGRRVITTYLDNDDALDIHFVEDLQKRASGLADGTFVYYTNGYQYFTEFGLLLRINYRRNHFVSVIETGTAETVKTIFGYGSHYYIDKIPGAAIKYVEDRPLWCEVIHPRNMGNDAYFLLGAKMMRDEQILRRDFNIDETTCHGLALYAFRFIPRFFVVFFRRIKYFLFGRKW